MMFGGDDINDISIYLLVTLHDEILTLCLCLQYGHPAAARAWSQTRDKFLNERFNKDGWTCHRCMMDTCVYRFTKGDHEVLALIHTDDVDNNNDWK